MLRLESFATAPPLYLKGRIGVDCAGHRNRRRVEKLILVSHGETIKPPPIGKKLIFRWRQPYFPRPRCQRLRRRHHRRSPAIGLCARSRSRRSCLRERSPSAYQCSWSDAIESSVLADTSEVDAILHVAAGPHEASLVAVGFDVAVATLETLNRTMEGSVAKWNVWFTSSRKL